MYYIGKGCEVRRFTGQNVTQKGPFRTSLLGACCVGGNETPGTNTGGLILASPETRSQGWSQGAT